MLQTAFITLLFLASATLELAFFHTLPHPFSIIPLHFILGILLLHRGGLLIGGAWFALSSIALPMIGFNDHIWFAWLVLGMIGPALTQRLFTNRSVYALMGLGASLYAIMLGIDGASHLITSFFGARAFQLGAFLQEGMIEMLWVLGFLYLGFLFARYTEHLLKDVFIVKPIRRHVS